MDDCLNLNSTSKDTQQLFLIILFLDRDRQHHQHSERGVYLGDSRVLSAC